MALSNSRTSSESRMPAKLPRPVSRWCTFGISKCTMLDHAYTGQDRCKRKTQSGIVHKGRLAVRLGLWIPSKGISVYIKGQRDVSEIGKHWLIKQKSLQSQYSADISWIYLCIGHKKKEWTVTLTTNNVKDWYYNKTLKKNFQFCFWTYQGFFTFYLPLQLLSPLLPTLQKSKG